MQIRKEYEKEYRLKNRERLLLLQKNWYQKNKKSKNEKSINYRKNNLEKIQMYNKEYKRLKANENPKKYLLLNSKKRAKRDGIEHFLTEEDIIVPSHCPVFGIELSFSSMKDRDKTPSIDRIDNTKGYIKGNIVIVSAKANRLKGDATVNEMEKLYNFYRVLCSSASM